MCGNCALGFHKMCHGSCDCDHLPTDPLLLAVHVYNQRAKAEGFKPRHLRFDEQTPYGVLLAAAATCRLKLAAESSLLFKEGMKRRGPRSPRPQAPRPENPDKGSRNRKRDKHSQPQKELALV